MRTVQIIFFVPHLKDIMNQCEKAKVDMIFAPPKKHKQKDYQTILKCLNHYNMNEI